MEIRSLQLKNFLSVGDEPVKIDFNKLTTIVGPNDSGKTNIFRAISFVSECLSNNATDPDPYYHNSDLTKDLEVQLGFEPNDDELEAFANFIFCSILSDRPQVDSIEKDSQAINLIEKFLTDHSKTIADDLFKQIIIIVRRTEARSIYLGDILIKLGKNNKELFLKQHTRLTKNPNSIQGSKNLGAIIINHIRKKNRDEVNSYLKNESNKMPDFKFSKDEIQDFFYRIDPVDNSAVYDLRSFNFGDGNIREKNYPQAVRLLEFLKQKGWTERGVAALDIISKVVSSSLVRTYDLRSKPQSFLNIANTLPAKSVLLDRLTGENLPEVLFRLRNSSYPHIRSRYNQIQTAFKNLCDNLEFEINIRPKEVTHGRNKKVVSIGPEYVDRGQKVKTVVEEDEDKKSLENELEIHFIKGNNSYPLEYSAAGRFEILLLLTALIGQQGKIILLDEPAINLHPVLQRRILEIIETNIAQENNNQIIIITHSPYLVNPQNVENIWRASRTKDGTTIVNVGKSLDGLPKDDKEKIIKNLHDSDIRSMFFSKGVVLVEGPSDRLVIEQVERFYSSKNKGADLHQNDWYVLDMDGKHSLPTYLRLVKNLHLPYIVVMDYDALMHCDKDIKINSKSIPASAIPRGLFLIGLLDENQIDKIKELGNSLEDMWYPKNKFDILDTIARLNKIFVFTRDLEGTLHHKVKTKESKPLKDLNLVLQKIEENSLPEEFEKMTEFIGKEIKIHASE